MLSRLQHRSSESHQTDVSVVSHAQLNDIVPVLDMLHRASSARVTA